MIMLTIPKSSHILSETLLRMSTNLSQIPKSTKFRRKGNMLPWVENKLQIHRIISTWKVLTFINYVLTDCLFRHVPLFSSANMLTLTTVLMLDIFGSSDYFQPVLKILIISVLMLDIFGSSKNFQPVLEISIISGANMLTFTFLTVPLKFNATSEQTSQETVGTSKRVTRTEIHILLQSVYIRKNRHKKAYKFYK